MFRVSVIGLSMAALLATVAPSFGTKATTFVVRVENVSTPMTLKLSNGTTAPNPNSPGLWAVHTGANPFFAAGKPAPAGLEWQAEDGNPGELAKNVPGLAGVLSTGLFNVPVGETMPGPARPGKAFEFAFTAAPGCKLSLTTMFGQSNDLFYSMSDKGVELFDAKGAPVTGDITSQLLLWDAGTEVNQEPGLGSDQGPRQKATNTGAAENGVVQQIAGVKDGFAYPATKDVLHVTISVGNDKSMAAR